MDKLPSAAEFELDDEAVNAGLSHKGLYKTTSGQVKSEADRTDSLSVPPFNHRRSPSPDAISLISLDDFSELRRFSSRTHTDSFSGPTGGTVNAVPLPDSTARARGFSGALRSTWTRNKGVVLVMFAELFGTLMAASTRVLVTDGTHGVRLHPFQILFVRFSITCLLSNLYMWWNSVPHFPFGAKDVRPLLITRGLGGFFGVFGFYWALQYLAIADAIVITFLAPFATCIICSKLMGAPFTRREQICGILSLFGIVLIARPTAIFSAAKSSSSPSPTQSLAPDATSSIISAATATIAAVAAAAAGADEIPSISPSAASQSVSPKMRLAAVGMSLVGVCGAACAYTSIRWIGQRAHPLISVNYFATWCLFVSTMALCFVPSVPFALPRNWTEWGLMLFVGVFGFITQFLLTAGLSYSRDSRATHMVYSQMLFALAFDKILWDVTPGALDLAGSTLILGSAIFVAVQNSSTGAGVGAQKDAGAGLATAAPSTGRTLADEEVGLVQDNDADESDDIAELEEERGRKPER